MIDRIGFVGGGVMAEAFIRGLLSQGIVRPHQIVAGDPLADRRAYLAHEYSVATTERNQAAADGASIVILAVKPQHIGETFADLNGALSHDQLVVSIAAGVPIRSMTGALDHQHVARVMPNTPAQIGAGMSVWTTTPSVGDAHRAQVQTILRALGRELFVSDERYLDMATAINGSGPGFVFVFLEAMIDAGVHIGLPRSIAEELVLQTVLGSTLMARETGKHPAVLKNMVTSPGGTTAEGIQALEDGRLRATIDRAVVAAFERSKQLGL